MRLVWQCQYCLITEPVLVPSLIEYEKGHIDCNSQINIPPTIVELLRSNGITIPATPNGERILSLFNHLYKQKI